MKKYTNPFISLILLFLPIPLKADETDQLKKIIAIQQAQINELTKPIKWQKKTLEENKRIPSGKWTLLEELSYKNLTPGKTYRIHGAIQFAGSGGRTDISASGYVKIKADSQEIQLLSAPIRQEASFIAAPIVFDLIFVAGESKSVIVEVKSATSDNGESDIWYTKEGADRMSYSIIEELLHYEKVDL